MAQYAFNYKFYYTITLLIYKQIGANYNDDMDLMQGIMKDIKDFMLNDKVSCESAYHELMSRLNEKSFHQDPEYNYLGCDGWSLSFKFGSMGY